MDLIFYFAYGSNMLAERLQRRCRSALVHGVAVAQDYGLAFSKIGQDGSGKATLVPARGLRTYGVVFQISVADLGELDRIEGRGRGYERHDNFPMRRANDGTSIGPTATYMSGAPYLDDSLLPFDWYLNLVAHGARQNGLPSTHIEAITATRFSIDADLNRPQRIEAIEVLAQAGVDRG